MELGSALLGEKVFWQCPNTSFVRTHKLKGNAKLHITSWLGRKSSDKEVAEEREKKAREFFEKLKEKEKARVQQMEELQRKMVIQNDLEAVQASEWSKSLAKWQGASKGTPWDPEPAFAIPFSDFWKLLEANKVQFMEYDNLGQDVAVIVPYFEDAKDSESISEKSKNASDAKGVESASEKSKDSSDVESASGKSKNGSDILDRPIVFKRHKVTQMPADCWTDIWGRLHQQLIHVQVNNTRSSVAMQIYPTLETVVIWGMRVAVAMLLYIWLQRTLYPWYKPRDPNDRPRYKPAKLSYFDLTGLGSLGQSRARFISAEESTGVTFDDFAGQEYVKRELQEVVKILKDTGELRSVGIYCPKGVLLYGPPGTGKTLLAKAIAGEAGVPFFSASGSEFVEMFVGVAAARVRDLFSRARQFAPAIIFIDEIDAIGAKRGGPDIGGGGVEREQGLIQILTELDGFWTMDAKVLVVGATNRLDMLDPALLRKGRFDKVIHVGLPTEAGRLAILRVHARNKGWASESEKEKLLREVASLTVDHSGAELQNILNEASILSARKDKDIIEREELLEALKRQEGFFKTGEEDVEDVSGETRMRVAYREAAIAVLECYFPNPRRPFSKTTIRSLDIVPNMEYIDSPSAIRLCKKSDIIDSIIRTCAPRVVEDQIFGKDNVSWISGASLEEAGILIDYLILQTGMTALGKIHYQTKRDVVVNIGPKIQALRDEYLRYAMEKCAGVLKEYRSALETIAAVLLEKLDLEADEIWDIFNKAPRMPQPEPAPIDEYGSLIYCGRWGIYGVTLPGRVTFNPGSSGFATFGAPRPQQLKVFHDDTWKLMDSLYKKRVEDRRKKKGESFKQEMPDLISQQIL